MDSVTIFCSRCKRVEVIERSPSDSGRNLAIEIPSHTVQEGVITYSVVHKDHTLIIDVDKNGMVLGEKIVNRIDQQVENYMTIAAANLIDFVRRYPSRSVSIFFFIESSTLFRILFGIFQNLLINIPYGSQGTFSFQKKMFILELDNVVVFGGEWSDKIYRLVGEENFMVYEFNPPRSEEILEWIHQDRKQGVKIEHQVLFRSHLVDEPKYRKALQVFSFKSKVFNFADISSMGNAVITVLRLMDRFFNIKD